ncbi:MAG: alkaline phosphatase [Bacteroidales bacterium]|nr:alkaline phosphatase [Bacteroidales bacterium]
MRRLSLISIVLVVLFSCNEVEKLEQQTKKAKNIILLIGDGMGVTQIYAAMSVSEKPLSFEKFKHIGFHKTHSATDFVTDSGAGGTALSTGNKTRNKCISVDTSGNPLKTILEYAEENQLATGLISTSSILHATPAAFIAHEQSRYNYENIALDFLDVDIDVFIGGGKKQFVDREDKLNLIDSLRKNQYNVIDGINNFNPEADGKFAVFTADEHNPEYVNGRGDMLPVSTEKAIKSLSKHEKGFFLMVEGSQIDWGGEDNDIDYVINETIDFDNAIAKALEFAIEDGETLVIVTSDHETGGLSIVDGDLETKTIITEFSIDYHTAVMVPVFAFGPGAEEFGGIYENTAIFEKMMKAFGFSK